MPRGTCKLCLGKKELQDSHYLPQGVYKYVRDPDPNSPNPNPVQVTTSVVQTSKQVKDYVLCYDCEQLLNLGGEKWVIPRLATDKRSPLFEILCKREPSVLLKDGGVYYVADVPEIDVPKLVHFAVSVFWKGSVHTWKKNALENAITLGPYSDGLRRFLLARHRFPST